MSEPHHRATERKSDIALARRIEEASLNAWPALQQIFLDGWVLRFARGFTKRSNCIVPLYPGASDQAAMFEKVRHCENLYAREQLQTVFRLRSIGSADAALDDLLAARGYRHEDVSLVMQAALTRIMPTAPGEARLALLPLDRWLEVYCLLTDMPEPARGLHNVILKSIAGECGFAALYLGEQPVACGLAVVERELAGMFDVFTHRDYRNLGLARTLAQGLLSWSAERGARRAYLQMVQDNAPAAALYARLGFTEIYRYWYRIGP